MAKNAHPQDEKTNVPKTNSLLNQLNSSRASWLSWKLCDFGSSGTQFEIHRSQLFISVSLFFFFKLRTAKNFKVHNVMFGHDLRTCAPVMSTITATVCLGCRNIGESTKRKQKKSKVYRPARTNDSKFLNLQMIQLWEINEVEKAIQHFEKESGARLNREKTCVMGLGEWTKRDSTGQSFKWVNQTAYLGVFVRKDMLQAMKDTRQKVTRKLKTAANLWKARTLSLRGKRW